MSAMTRLILTTDASAAGSLRTAGRADIVIPFGLRFVWGPLPSDAELQTLTGLTLSVRGISKKCKQKISD